MENLNVLMTNVDISNAENEEPVFDEELDEDSNRFELCLEGRLQQWGST